MANIDSKITDRGIIDVPKQVFDTYFFGFRGADFGWNVSKYTFRLEALRK